MRLVIVAVGSPRHPAVRSLLREYEERANRYFRLESIEVPGAKGHGGNPDRARAEEARSIEGRLPRDLETWAVTRTGKEMSSRDLADRMGRLASGASPGAAFVIGGAFGIDPSLLASCAHSLSLSCLTLPHELARLVLVEQIYRAGTILRGEPYHKGD